MFIHNIHNSTTRNLNFTTNIQGSSIYDAATVVAALFRFTARKVLRRAETEHEVGLNEKTDGTTSDFNRRFVSMKRKTSRTKHLLNAQATHACHTAKILNIQ